MCQCQSLEKSDEVQIIVQPKWAKADQLAEIQQILAKRQLEEIRKIREKRTSEDYHPRTFLAFLWRSL